MPKPSIPKQEAPWQRFALAAVAGAAAIAAVVFWQSGSKDEPHEGVPEHKSATVFGPGVLTGTDTQGSLSRQEQAPDQFANVPGRLDVDANQQLTISPGLLEVFDYFLLEQSGPDRAAALKNYLKSKLPPGADKQAESIADHYRAYMSAYDELLKGQNLGGEDITSRAHNIERLLAWREQRNRLRMDILGEEVVQAWYQNDEAELDQVIQELRQRNQATSNDATSSRDPDDEAEHEHDMQRVLNRATKSYAALTQEKHLWAQRLAAFQVAVAKINQQTNIPAYQREHQIADLLQKTFQTDEERQRARDLMP